MKLKFDILMLPCSGSSVFNPIADKNIPIVRTRTEIKERHLWFFWEMPANTFDPDKNDLKYIYKKL